MLAWLYTVKHAVKTNDVELPKHALAALVVFDPFRALQEKCQISPTASPSEAQAIPLPLQ